MTVGPIGDSPQADPWSDNAPSPALRACGLPSRKEVDSIAATCLAARDSASLDGKAARGGGLAACLLATRPPNGRAGIGEMGAGRRGKPAMIGAPRTDVPCAEKTREEGPKGHYR